MLSFLQSLFHPLFDTLPTTPIASWQPFLPAIIERGLDTHRYGDLPQWCQSLESLPRTQPSSVELNDAVRIGSKDDIDNETTALIEKHLRELMPWRKGPLWIHDIFIDTEWRSDWKWQRVLPHLDNLSGRLVLDVGCGNGYHCWRMLGAGAERVVGIDPSPRFVVQFYAIKHFVDAALAATAPVDVIPATLDDFPDPLPVFDTVFSMGVLYHRHSPIDHLRQLKQQLRSGGQLVLETLLIRGQQGRVLVPEQRYAMMNNVWFLPSPDTLLSWLRKCGFVDVRLVDLNQTTMEEQRSTDWMRFHSLAQFLDPNNPMLTVEGHPAPLRGIFTARAP